MEKKIGNHLQSHLPSNTPISAALVQGQLTITLQYNSETHLHLYILQHLAANRGFQCNQSHSIDLK